MMNDSLAITCLTIMFLSSAAGSSPPMLAPLLSAEEVSVQWAGYAGEYFCTISLHQDQSGILKCASRMYKGEHVYGVKWDLAGSQIHASVEPRSSGLKSGTLSGQVKGGLRPELRLEFHGLGLDWPAQGVVHDQAGSQVSRSGVFSPRKSLEAYLESTRILE